MRCEHRVEVGCSPEKAFALLDDLPQTPKWLAPCTAIEKVVPGPNRVGDQLKYSYLQGGRAGTMQGEILARNPTSKLTCRYFDKMFEIVVDFNVAKSPGGASLTHVITITPKTWISRLMSPLVAMALPKQTREAMASLKTILDSQIT